MKKIAILSFFFCAVAVVCFLNFEPTVSRAAGTFQATSSVNLTVTGDLAVGGCLGSTGMSNTMGIGADTAIGTGTLCTISTSNTTGYNVTVNATTSPALKNASNSFTDAASGSPAAFNTLVGGGTYKFAYTVMGTHAKAAWGNPVSCGKAVASFGDVNPNEYYTGFGTIATTTANWNSIAINDTFQLCYAAGQNGTYAPSGVYQASAVVTVTTNP